MLYRVIRIAIIARLLWRLLLDNPWIDWIDFCNHPGYPGCSVGL